MSSGPAPTLRDIYGLDLGSLQDTEWFPLDRHGSLCYVQRILQESRKEPLALPLLALGQTSPSEGAEGNSCIWNQPILGVFQLSSGGGQPGGAAPDRGCHRAVSLTLGIDFCILVEKPAEPSPRPPTTRMDTRSHRGACLLTIESSLPPGSQIRKMFFSRHAAPIQRWSVYFQSFINHSHM